MTGELILSREIDGRTIGQRQGDGYVNATALCKAAGKLWADYRRLDSTAAFLTELAGSMGIPIDHLCQIIKAGANDQRGTWVHPDVAVNLAQWLSPRFAVQVSRWVRELMLTGATATRQPHPEMDLLNLILARLDRLEKVQLPAVGAPVTIMPMTTVRERCRYWGWSHASWRQRDQIKRKAVALLVLEGNPPFPGDGPTAPLRFSASHLRALDDAIAQIREEYRKKEEEVEKTLFGAVVRC